MPDGMPKVCNTLHLGNLIIFGGWSCGAGLYLAQMVGIFVDCGLVVPIILSVEFSIVWASYLLLNCCKVEPVKLLASLLATKYHMKL